MKAVTMIEVTTGSEFKIKTSDRDYVFRCETEEDKISWSKALDNARRKGTQIVSSTGGTLPRRASVQKF